MLEYYEISFYNGNKGLGGQILQLSQLKNVKYHANFYFKAFRLKEINIRMKIYNQNLPETKLELIDIEVF